MNYLLCKNDIDGHKDELFYYVVDDSYQTFIKAIDENCNEISLPMAFTIVDRNPVLPSCVQP